MRGVQRVTAVGALRLIFSLALAGLLLGGCAARTNRHPIINRSSVQVDLVTEITGFATTTPQGFEHPAIISTERLVNVLNAVEVDTPSDGGGVIRQPAFHPEIVATTAAALAEAFAEADADQELGVKVYRKYFKLGIFQDRRLTSFLAHMRDGHLYLTLSRVDWPIPKTHKNAKVPEPQYNEQPMDFRVVSGPLLYYAGPQSLEIAWQDTLFRKPYHVPGTSGGEKRRREVLFQSPVPNADRESRPGDEVSVEDLTPDQLRALADLEEDRRQGRITESDYQRSKRQLLRTR